MDDRAGGMGLIFRTADWQVPICDADTQPHIRPARHTRLGLSELSALSTLSRKGRSLRNQTLLEIMPEGNGELASSTEMAARLDDDGSRLGDVNSKHFEEHRVGRLAASGDDEDRESPAQRMVQHRHDALGAGRA